MKTESITHQTRAIVIGGSMAGLLAARVLADSFSEVIILERDSLDGEGKHRRGVPHGRHAHAILAGGLHVIEDHLPGISAELISAGAVISDPLNDGRWYFEGNHLKRGPSGTQAIMLGRPMLEEGIRRRVRSLDNVRIVDNQAVRGLIATPGRVTGVQTSRGRFLADLVVDASGRGSRGPQWLKAMGFSAPEEEKVEMKLVYTTRVFRRRPHHMNGDTFVVVTPTPEGKRGGVALAKENDEWIVTLYGHFGHRAPEDLDGYLDYARSLPQSAIYEFLRDAEPIGDATVFNFPASVRRRYERLERLPAGFMVFGDAICSFNPIYGQGMSSAALQARALSEELKLGTGDIARRFYAAAATVIDNPWSIAVGSDLKMPETQGRRGLDVRMINRYMGLLHRRGHDHLDASLAFVRVAQLLDPPASLLKPSLAVRVVASALKRMLGIKPSSRDHVVTDVRPSGEWRADGF